MQPSDIPGFLDEDEGQALRELAQEHFPGEVVEIGSFKGRSTAYLAQGLEDRKLPGLVHAVDHFQGSPEHRQGGEHQTAEVENGGSLYPTFRDNLKRAGFVHRVAAHIGNSADIALVWGAPIRLLFIDGAHDLDSVLHDYCAWSKFVTPHGAICFHDYRTHEFVTRVADTAKFARREVVGTLLIGRLHG